MSAFGGMQFDIDGMAPIDRYELLLGTIVPRPIALITTLGPDGSVNAAPYSLFNVMGHDPAVAMVSVLAHPEARLKDTANNILATKEFVINLVSETVAETMNITCIDAPPGVNELELANLKTSASIKVKPPRVAASPVSFECRFLTSISFGPNQAIVAGHIVHAYIEDRFVLDQARGLIDTCPLYPRKRTCAVQLGMSALCQKRTSSRARQRLLDLTLANPIGPSWPFHFKTVREFCVPFRAMHSAD
jgi:flavin reductase (DIM6/NTAB) family NADH-FMN oxidoreductase RutF